MPASSLGEAVRNYEQARAAKQAALSALHDAIRQNYPQLTVREIMAQTGYSRRRVFQILHERQTDTP